MAPRSLRLRIDSDLRQVARVGEAIRELCSTIPLSKLQALDVELCAVEAVNNSILHAYHQLSGSLVEVEARFRTGRLVIRVSDRGTPLTTDPSAKAALPDSTRPAECGRGLYLICSLMDEVRYASRRGRNTLTMSKRISREDQNP